jgi:hypothetical protein
MSHWYLAESRILKPCLVGCGSACLPVFPALEKLRQENFEFEASVDYKVSPYKTKQNKQ